MVNSNPKPNPKPNPNRSDAGQDYGRGSNAAEHESGRGHSDHRNTYGDERGGYREQDDFGDSFHYNGPPMGLRRHNSRPHHRPTDFDPLHGDFRQARGQQGYSGYTPQYRIDEEPGQRLRHESDWRVGAERANAGAEHPAYHGGHEQWPVGFSSHDHEHQAQGRHPDPDYHQWRNEQIRNLDRDYEDYRRERYGKFAEDFNKWRSDRASRAQEKAGESSTTESPTAGKAALLHPGSINPGSKQ